MAKASVFKMVGVGVVANNKAIMEREIEVTPTEWLPMHDGEMASNAAKMTHKTKDIDGNESQGMMLTDQVIKATWMPSGSNRLSPPDVRRGVHVELWATADADKYYWKTMGLDDHLHKLETIVIGISNTTDESVTELKPENMYWIEFSTHSKRLAFCSSKSQGELYQHELYIDTDAGEFMYTDDIGNFLNVQSKVNLIHLQNAKGTFVKIDQQDIKMYAPQDMFADIKRNIEVKAGKDIKVTAGNNIDVEAKQNLRTKGGVLASIDGGGSKMTLTAAGTTLKTPKFTGSR
ncbi:hypothetical protein D3C85_244850 [compost metagenome]